uniref:Otopetrin-2 n=1 Tax=Cacopsylla melanoneura TaxID=428564 RepID=A0A8D9AJP4_9HEMI
MSDSGGGGKTRRGGHGGKLKNSRSILGFLNSRNSGLLEQKESFSYFWVLLSTLYGKILIVLMIAFCLIEVMDNSIKLLTLQGLYLIYLYVGSIAVIICIYIWVLIDSCSSWNTIDSPNITTSVMADAELGSMTMSRFDSLKRAHISRAKTSATSFYIRIGALAFGLGTLVFNGLEMAMHSLMEGSCLGGVVFVHPVLHGLFTFLQMHFLFVNSQVLVEKFGPIARFGFMHLAATNLALWIRLVIWESGVEWVYFVHLAQSSGGSQRSLGTNSDIPTPLHLRGYPKFITESDVHHRVERNVQFAANATWNGYIYRPISEAHISQVVTLHQCLNTNSLGQLWTSSMPFLYPFIVQFSLIAAGVTYVMCNNVGIDRLKSFRYINSINKKHHRSNDTSPHHKNKKSNYSYEVDAIDCSSASKGLFLGLLCLVIVIVIIIIFLVVKEDPDFPMEILFWMTSGTLSGILVISLISCIIGLYQIRKLSHTGYIPTQVDKLFSSVTVTGVIFYSVFGIVIGCCGLYITLSSDNADVSNYDKQIHMMLIFVNTVQLLQTSFQSTLLGEALRRGSITTHQILTKPGSQVITFLLCSNGALWAFDSFITQSWLSQELQLRFMGLLAWGVISRISLPLLVFYRFHSGVLLLEIWQRTYRSFKFDNLN